MSCTDVDYEFAARESFEYIFFRSRSSSSKNCNFLSVILIKLSALRFGRVLQLSKKQLIPYQIWQVKPRGAFARSTYEIQSIHGLYYFILYFFGASHLSSVRWPRLLICTRCTFMFARRGDERVASFNCVCVCIDGREARSIARRSKLLPVKRCPCRVPNLS